VSLDCSPAINESCNARDFGFVFFEEPQASPHNIAGRTITASLHLLTE